jgi:hypothetical protein
MRTEAADCMRQTRCCGQFLRGGTSEPGHRKAFCSPESQQSADHERWFLMNARPNQQAEKTVARVHFERQTDDYGKDALVEVMELFRVTADTPTVSPRETSGYGGY